MDLLLVQVFGDECRQKIGASKRIYANSSDEE